MTPSPVPFAPLPRRAVHGVLLLDKPLGWTSNDALQKAKRLLRAEKAGHTGTLDPLATGPAAAVLRCGHQVLAGQPGRRQGATAPRCAWASARPPATPKARCVREHAVHDRRRGAGRLPAASPAHRAAAADALRAQARRQGAVRLRARRHRDRARAAPRDIHRIDIVDWQDELVIDVSCSKGTYIRTLAEDIGRALGCGAHLARCAARPAARSLSRRGHAGRSWRP
jgi:tRNA pseudouridine55 synthase